MYPSQSESIRVNPKKNFSLVWCKSVENLSDLIRESEALNPNESGSFFNPDESEVEIVWIENSWSATFVKDKVCFLKAKMSRVLF